MKKLIISLAILAGCNPFHHREPSREEVSRSVYQVRSDIEVDPRPVCADAKDEAGNDDVEGCVARLYEALGSHTYHFRFMGTAWVSGNSRGRTQLVTAGHLCETRESYEYVTRHIVLDENGFRVVEQTFELPILHVGYVLRAADGTEFSGATALVDDDEQDVCLMSVSGDLGDPLRVADSDPEYGAHCYTVGAPQGLWGGGLAMISEETFAGRIRIKDLPEMLSFSGAATGGASGSPQICDGRVVGVLDRADRAFPFNVAAPWEAIRQVMEGTPHRR